MINYCRYPIWVTVVSLLLIVSSLIVLNLSYSSIAESLSIMRLSNEINSSTQSLHSDISELAKRQKLLQTEIKRLNDLERPCLESFSKIAEKFDLRLTGVNLKEKPVLETKENKCYSLIFTGEISGALNALDYMEKNLMVSVEALSLYPNESNADWVNLSIQVSIPDLENETR